MSQHHCLKWPEAKRMNKALIWDGRTFVQRGLESTENRSFYFREGESPYWPMLDGDLGTYRDAMKINPKISCVMGPVLHRFEPFTSLLDGMREEFLQEHGARKWRKSSYSGFCNYHKTEIVVAFCGGLDPLVTLYHELFHSIYDMFTEHELEILEEHGNQIRDVNRGKDWHKRIDECWIRNEEEAEALAFDCWATGQRPPHGIEAGKHVVNIWRRVIAGRYAK